MKIVRTEDLINTDRHAKPTGCESIRLIVESDDMGFGVHKTLIPEGGPHHWHYPNHLEACYCVSGSAMLVNLDTGDSHFIIPDTIYLLDNHDNHTFEAFEDTVLISVFNPPVNGDEVHNENGHYPASAARKDKAQKIVRVCDECDSLYDAFDEVVELL